MSSISFEEFISRVHAKDINFYQLANSAIQGKIDQIEVSFRYQTNITNKWFKLKGSLLNNSHGNPYISGLLFDITRDKSQEINTQRLQKTLSEVIDSLPYLLSYGIAKINSSCVTLSIEISIPYLQA